MKHVSFDRVSFCYDFIEKYILKDYQGSMDLMNRYLSLHKNFSVIDIGGGTGFFSKEIIEKINKVVVVDPSSNTDKLTMNSEAEYLEEKLNTLNNNADKFVKL